jgi:hypothetical protein
MVGRENLTMDHVVPLDSRREKQKGKRGCRLQGMQQPKKVSASPGMGGISENPG